MEIHSRLSAGLDSPLGHLPIIDLYELRGKGSSSWDSPIAGVLGGPQDIFGGCIPDVSALICRLNILYVHSVIELRAQGVMRIISWRV